MRWNLLSLACVLASVGCLASGTSYSAMPPYTVDLTSADFVEGIDNPFLPFRPGASWTYLVGSEERIEVRVLPETRTIMGVRATVVRDTVYDPGWNVIEDTYDWYAQDRDGNVWYLGEDTCEYKLGECVDRGGSFEWGVDGALPGIVMHADPKPGEPYYQEYYKGEAVDRAQTIARGERVETRLGSFTDTVVTKEWNPLHPEIVERVVYARGIGPVIKGEYDEETKQFDSPEELAEYS